MSRLATLVTTFKYARGTLLDLILVSLVAVLITLPGFGATNLIGDQLVGQTLTAMAEAGEWWHSAPLGHGSAPLYLFLLRFWCSLFGSTGPDAILAFSGLGYALTGLATSLLFRSLGIAAHVARLSILLVLTLPVALAYALLPGPEIWQAAFAVLGAGGLAAGLMSERISLAAPLGGLASALAVMAGGATGFAMPFLAVIVTALVMRLTPRLWRLDLLAALLAFALPVGLNALLAGSQAVDSGPDLLPGFIAGRGVEVHLIGLALIVPGALPWLLWLPASITFQEGVFAGLPRIAAVFLATMLVAGLIVLTFQPPQSTGAILPVEITLMGLIGSCFAFVERERPKLGRGLHALPSVILTIAMLFAAAASNFARSSDVTFFTRHAPLAVWQATFLWLGLLGIARLATIGASGLSRLMLSVVFWSAALFIIRVELLPSVAANAASVAPAAEISPASPQPVSAQP